MDIAIGKYLHELLYQYSSVTIPKLGTLVTVDTPALLDESNNRLHPPAKTVAFNEELRVDDGLLVNYIAQRTRIARDEVQEEVEHFVMETKQSLESGEPVILDPVGSLFKNLADHIQIIPQHDLNLSMETFGLGSLELATQANISEQNFDNQDFTHKNMEDKSPKSAEESPETTFEEMAVASLSAKTLPDLVANVETKATSEQASQPKQMGTKKTNINKQSIQAAPVVYHTKANLPAKQEDAYKKDSSRDKWWKFFWMWLLPLSIVGLFLLLLFQLNSSNHSWKERTAFKYTYENNANNSNYSDKATANVGDSDSDSYYDNTEYGRNVLGEDNKNVFNEETTTERALHISESDINNNYQETDNSDASTEEENNFTSNNNDIDNITTTNNSDLTGETDYLEEPEKSVLSFETKNISENSNITTNLSQSNTNSSAQTTDTTDKTAVSQNNTSNNQPKKSNTTKPKSKPKPKVKANNPKGYYIIVGAFGNKRNAQNLANKLKKSRLDARVLSNPTGGYRTGVYASRDLGAAKKLFLKVKQEHSTKAWVFSL